jgi:very-short-patch-repair endonuclease
MGTGASRFDGTAHVLPSSLLAATPSPISCDELVLRPIADAAELHTLVLTIYQKQGYRQLSDAGCLALMHHLSKDLTSCSAHSSKLYACVVDELRMRGVKVSFRDALMILQTAVKRQPSSPEDWDRISVAFAYFVVQSAESLRKEWIALPELLAWLRDVSSMPYGGNSHALKGSVSAVLDRISDVYAKEMSLDDILTCGLSCQKYQVNGEGWNTLIKQMELAAQQASLPADTAVKLLYLLATANRLDPISAQRLIAMVQGMPLSEDLHQMWAEVLYFAESEHLLSERKRYCPPYQAEGFQIAGVLEQIRPGVYRQFPIGPYVVSACYRDIRVAVEVVGPAERAHPGKQSLRSRYIENEYYTIVQVDRDEWRARSESQRFDYLNNLISVHLRQSQNDVWSTPANSSKGLGLRLSEPALTVEDDVEEEPCEQAEAMIALLRHGGLSELL